MLVIDRDTYAIECLSLVGWFGQMTAPRPKDEASAHARVSWVELSSASMGGLLSSALMESNAFAGLCSSANSYFYAEVSAEKETVSKG